MAKTKHLYKNDYTANLPLNQFELHVAINQCPKRILNGTRKGILQSIASNQPGWELSYSLLSEQSGYSERCVKDNVAWLEANDWLDIKHGNCKDANRYWVTIPGCYQRQAVTSAAGHQYIGIIYPDRKRAPTKVVQEMHNPSAGDAHQVVQEMHTKLNKERDIKKMVAAPPVADEDLSSPDIPYSRGLVPSDSEGLEESVPPPETDGEYDPDFISSLSFMKSEPPPGLEKKSGRPTLDEILETVYENQKEFYQ